MSEQPTPAVRARIAIAQARNVLTDIQAVPLTDPTTARAIGRMQGTVENLIEQLQQLLDDSPHPT